MERPGPKVNIRPRTTAARLSSALRLAPAAKSRRPRCEVAETLAERTRSPFMRTWHHNSLRDAIRHRENSIVRDARQHRACRVVGAKRNLRLAVRASCAGDWSRFRPAWGRGVCAAQSGALGETLWRRSSQLMALVTHHRLHLASRSAEIYSATRRILIRRALFLHEPQFIWFAIERRRVPKVAKKWPRFYSRGTDSGGNP